MNYNDNNPMSFSTREAAVSVDQGLRTYMLGVYNYMASALALTGIFAYLAANWAPLTEALYRFDGEHMTMTGLGWVVTFAPLAFVLFLSFGINRMELGTAKITFWAYAAVMGLSLSSILLIYTGASVARAFFSTAIVFGAMSLWGYSTKKDLTGMGHFLIMGLIGVIVASLINIFLHSSGLNFVVSILSVLIFTGLTAYDTQKLKAMYYQVGHDATLAGKFAIMGALSLYLDFINLFISLLRFMGDRR